MDAAAPSASLMRDNQRHAVIAGGGVGGLSAAIALARGGWRVSVCEAAPRIEEIGAGLQISPNASRILRQWNVLGDVASHGLRPAATRIINARTGNLLCTLPLGAVAEQRWGAPYLFSHRADLIQALYHAAQKFPAVHINTNSRITGFTHIEGGVEIALNTAHAHHIMRADLLIGADGLHSTIRSGLGLGLADVPHFSGHVAWRALVPSAAAPAFARAAECQLWLGPQAHCVHYPLRQNSLINIVAITQDKWRGQESQQRDEWNMAADRASLLQRFESWHDSLRALLAQAQDWRRWPLYDRPPIARWHDRHVALLGDAAHPMLPFLAQGAAMAIEDAEMLARVLSERDHDIASALRDYSAQRSPRASAVQLAARKQGRIYHLDGMSALARNMALRLMGSERLMSELDWIYDLRLR